MQTVYLSLVLAPLFGAIIAGLFGRQIGRSAAHWVTIIGVAISFLLSLAVFKHHVIDGAPAYNATVYTWMVIDGIRLEVGFLVDSLTVMMITVVTFVSLMVHIYTIGYMHDDPGYQRFFSYISLFTFSMLMLVMSNNFLQLFFGWEAVGVVSYLLIGFWFKRPTAIYANMKAFLVNRVGDFGFLLGIAAVLMYFNSLDYQDVFHAAPLFANAKMQIIPGVEWSVMTVTCILLFIGAMGKSAQVPLHVWLPDSMEGPTPISALIHAATMVTAGIFMVSRMSPLFELSTTALSFVLVIGSITALFMGFLGIIQNDIKRVVAYSTLSQLGYMTVALGVSAYSAAVFHLMTHAFFKALLFLGAGSVIIGMHHEQDMRKMGGLRKYMPITWFTSLLGSLALIGFPGFSGFYSKDSIIEAVHASHIPGSGFAYFAVIVGVFVTAFYSFRMYFLVFHGEERFHHHDDAHGHGHDAHHDDDHGHGHHGGTPHESPWVVTVPLILLAIPSVIIGGKTIAPMLFGDFFQGVIHVAHEHDTLHHLASEFHSALGMAFHGLLTLPFWLAMAGVGSAYYIYMKRPDIAEKTRAKFAPVYRLLDRKYGFDDFNQAVFADGSVVAGKALWKYGDAGLIDGVVVNGSAKTIGWLAGVVRHVQSGYLYHYAFAMIIGLLGLLTWIVVR
ncbi:MAG TPA: NADH-quinone oxidoreductase subunit L [Plasticicumulans sp.]|uniref:NADH-quinone oxidoreductase subunit L n=1 Tax=Plasticicumulans sp. TaxID=2307179 RepID=UPI002CE29820|nr:NADH-quinone oxidoreductase subunit L [Plasticicumulans sp.]HMW41601.1 NADH-quinone oxidoreductase subunit L [Plasticicumulans sp.]HNB88762.1 NADH-quinone oxidoreductase subunit L [Plasticicumulans sp.]HNF64932.1 NADH-quinone oxidoreductase subunit L [Plasticicumulans sp.]HNG50441.1 NADH-quinone oxidoreductase subunit L [Plasticicumulans sp.]HNM43831.1 NADH-quinone oxidoreductase subunit L [Plasticicumulans sp.]